jgi:hypothetical protein
MDQAWGVLAQHDELKGPGQGLVIYLHHYHRHLAVFLSTSPVVPHAALRLYPLAP